MHSHIIYISYFDFNDSPIQRGYVTSAATKVESICEAMNKAGYKVKIVSTANVTEPKFKIFRGQTIHRNENLCLKLFFSWGGSLRIIKKIRIIWHLIALFVYLLLHTSKNEPVIVYHSLGYFNAILWAKKIKRFKLILEVEEIYQDVGAPKFKRMAQYENAMFKAADAYIFPTELLNTKLNTENKPYVIIYGTYKVEPQIVEKFDDGKIHVVYAGTFDPRKGGAAAAVASAMFLPDNYHVHICGFGSPEDTENIKQHIIAIAKTSKAAITFEGLKKGQEYIKLIQHCHIGLSTQNPSAAFNATSFPSKILSYMANGISVVTIDIDVIRISAIHTYLNYYTEQSPDTIAKAIISANIDNNNRSKISELEQKFIKQLNHII